MSWTPESKICELPNQISKYFINLAIFLENQLKITTKKLENPKTFPEQKERIIESLNPYRYNQFYWENTPHKLRKHLKSFKKRKLKNNAISIDKRKVKDSLLKICYKQDKKILKYDTLIRKQLKKSKRHILELFNSNQKTKLEYYLIKNQLKH